MNGGKDGVCKRSEMPGVRKGISKRAAACLQFLFGPLEVDYDYDGIKKVLTRKLIESRGKSDVALSGTASH